MFYHLDVTLNHLHLKGCLDKWGMQGLELRCGQYTFDGTRAYMVRDLLIDLQLRGWIDKYNIPPCFGEHRMNRENDCPNPHTNPSTSISMCHIYRQRSKHKNASSDDKCGVEILMPNTKYARISLERMCNNDIIPDQISAKRILIFHYLHT